METITARPNAKLCIGLMAIFVLIPVLCVVGIHTSPPANPDFPIWPFDLMMLGTVLMAMVFLTVQMSKQVRADAAGLHWPRGGFMAWDEIADYYISPVVKSNQQTPFVVVGVSGRKLTFYPDWTNATDLRDRIPIHSRHAKTERWGVKGTRWVDGWPRTFAYSKRDRNILYGVLGGLSVLIIGNGLYTLATRLPRNIAEMGWGWGLSFGFVYLLVMVILPIGKIGLLIRLSGMQAAHTDEAIHRPNRCCLAETRYENRGAVGRDHRAKPVFRADQIPGTLGGADRKRHVRVWGNDRRFAYTAGCVGGERPGQHHMARRRFRK